MFVSLSVVSDCIIVSFISYMGLPQESTGRARCGRAQCQTHCTASLERLVYSFDRVLCYRSDNASFPQCSTCPRTLVCGKQVHTLNQPYDQYLLRMSSVVEDMPLNCKKGLWYEADELWSEAGALVLT